MKNLHRLLMYIIFIACAFSKLFAADVSLSPSIEAPTPVFTISAPDNESISYNNGSRSHGYYGVVSSTNFFSDATYRLTFSFANVQQTSIGVRPVDYYNVLSPSQQANGTIAFHAIGFGTGPNDYHLLTANSYGLGFREVNYGSGKHYRLNSTSGSYTLDYLGSDLNSMNSVYFNFTIAGQTTGTHSTTITYTISML